MSVIDDIDSQLLRAYDKFLLEGGSMQLEDFRKLGFRQLPAVDNEPLLPYYQAYLRYKNHAPTNVMSFSSFVRQRESRDTASVSIKEETESNSSESYETILPKFQDKIREYLEAVRMKQSDTDESCAIFKFIEQTWSQSNWNRPMENYVRNLMQYVGDRDISAFQQRKKKNIQEVTDLLKQLGYDDKLAKQYWKNYHHCNTNLLLTAVNSPEDVVMFKLRASDCKGLAQTFGLFLDIGKDYKKSSGYAPSAVKVETELLKQWQEEGVENMNSREEDRLVRSMRELCRASDWKSLRASNRFDASNPPSLPSACNHHRHDRLRRTHRFETAHSAAMADGGSPMHLVIYRVPSTGAVSRELVHSSELDPEHMIVYHSYISSKGILNWLKGKITRYTGAALPRGLKEYFENSENFAAAVAVAEEVFLDEQGKERGRPEAEAKIRKLTPPQKRDLLYALTQYMCYVIKQGKVRSLPSGANSIQAMHALVSRCTRHELRNPRDIYAKAQKYGYGSLTRSERQRLLTGMSSSSANARQLTAPPNVLLPEVKTGEQWKIEEIRELLTKSVMLYSAQVKQGIALAPAQPLRDIDSSRSDFIKDLRATIDARQAEQGTGFWLIPTNADYKADSNRDDTPEYFSHFFVDMSPTSSLGKLNRAALKQAEKEESDSVTLLTNAGTRVNSRQLFPDAVLRDDFHQRLFAFQADTMADPESDLTLVFQIQVIPDSLFSGQM